MDDVIDPTRRAPVDGGSLQSDPTTEAQVEARLRMESMSRVACALIFQSARDLVCALRTTAKPETRRPKVVRQADQWIQEISIWAKTVHPLWYENGGITLAGCCETINVHQDFRGGRRIDYWAVRECLLTEPHRLAVVDGPTEFRTLTSEPLDPSASETLNPDSSEDLIRILSEYATASNQVRHKGSSVTESQEGRETITRACPFTRELTD